MNEKIRVDGETIEAGKTYSYQRVRELMDTSFNNGYRAGLNEGYGKGYKNGWAQGHSDAQFERNADADTLNELRNILKKIIKEEKNAE